jgi:hypothetical protein
VLRLIETKFNLGALTRRDANASNLLDCLDLRSHRRPAFLDPPVLAAPGLPATGSTCEPGTPPPPTGASPTTVASSAPIPGLGHAARSAATVSGSPALSDSQDERMKLLANLVGAVHGTT